MTAALPQIKKIVWLTLENRSLDSVLGWLYEKQALSAEQVYPSGSSLRFDGISSSDRNSVTQFLEGVRDDPDRPTCRTVGSVD